MGRDQAKQTITPKGCQLPVVRTEADIDALTNLSQEEKAMAKDNLKWVMPSDGLWLLASDPELQALFDVYELGCEVLLAPDSQFIPFGPLNLICNAVGQYTGSEWVAATGAETTARLIDMFEKEDASHQRLGMVFFPDSACWTDE
ncbi:MAG: hypothetical protein HKP58_01840 [Desulfatitalea sp.]|nr:hypothetical protein [Desulfatitalea sp.]NNJ99129.1 hypothetical protein [Desulfatitalea sp.]